MTKVRQSLFMFGDLFGTEKFDYNTLVEYLEHSNEVVYK